jgi:hypothetical protein
MKLRPDMDTVSKLREYAQANSRTISEEAYCQLVKALGLPEPEALPLNRYANHCFTLDVQGPAMLELIGVAVSERRSVNWQAEVLLRKAMGLPFPHPR